MRATWWRSVEHRERLAKGVVVDLVIEPQFDGYRGGREVIGSVKDVRVIDVAVKGGDRGTAPVATA